MRFRLPFLAVLAITASAPLAHAQGVKAMWGSGPADVWALTEQPAVLHFDGRAWTQTPLPGLGTPLALWGSGPRDVFVVGEGGMAIRWDGTRWQRLSTGTTRTLVAIGGRSATEAYVVAQAEHDMDRPLLLRWDGRQFTPETLTVAFRGQSVIVTPTEVVVVGYAMFDPTPQERRTAGVVARRRGATWTVGGWDGRRATDTALVDVAWQRVCARGTGLSLVGQRNDGTNVARTQSGGRWSPLPAPTLPANAHAYEPTWVLAQDCTPLFLFGEGFARYVAGRWQVVAPALAVSPQTANAAAQQEMQALAQRMQAEVQAGRMPSQQDMLRLQQLQQGAMGQYQAQAAAASAAQGFAFGDGPAGWGLTGTDFWVGTEAGRVVHVAGDSATVRFDAVCLQPGMSGLPQCQGITVTTGSAPGASVPQPTRPAAKVRPSQP
jgi:hypothetical protein